MAACEKAGPPQQRASLCAKETGKIVLRRGSVKSKRDDAYTAVSAMLGTY